MGPTWYVTRQWTRFSRTCLNMTRRSGGGSVADFFRRLPLFLPPPFLSALQTICCSRKPFLGTVQLACTAVCQMQISSVACRPSFPCPSCPPCTYFVVHAHILSFTQTVFARPLSHMQLCSGRHCLFKLQATGGNVLLSVST
jgi:hypothetical protein